MIEREGPKSTRARHVVIKITNPRGTKMSTTPASDTKYAACNECFTYALVLNGICWPCTRTQTQPAPTPTRATTQSMYDICQDMRRNRRLGRKSGW